VTVGSPPPATAGIAYDDGIHLLGTVLWFDSHRERDLCFVSHAGGARIPAHRKVLATSATVQLANQVAAGAGSLVTPFSRPFSLGNLQLELFPAGHMLGSAQLRVVHQGATVVYAGDVMLRGTRTAEACQVRPCDTLVLNCRYGDPDISFPPTAEVEEELVAWVRATLDLGLAPVLLAPRLGKAQDLMHLLGERGIPVRAHRSIVARARIYQEHGVAFPTLRTLRGTPGPGAAVVWPIDLRHSPSLRRAGRKVRLAVCTGAALDRAREVRHHHAVDVAFPLSAHSDFGELLRYVRSTGAGTVYLNEGPTGPLAEALAAMGIDVRLLAPPRQLALV
jgi:putative mRNA 3-end processing factor